MSCRSVCLSVQLLGDYDKVKAVSEGSDCQCKCVVRPLGRAACRRVNEGTARKEDFYTVETVSSGSSCKCACIAPPSALNPCEGDFRLQKLREADSRDLKVRPRREASARGTRGPVGLTGLSPYTPSEWTCVNLSGKSGLGPRGGVGVQGRGSDKPATFGPDGQGRCGE